MGAWSTDPFGNDTACDWKYEQEEYSDLSYIASTLDKLHDLGDNYLEAPDAEEAIAAADCIARLRGNFYVRNSYTESLDAWVEKHPIEPPASLVESALRAIDRIMTEPSELLELWKESDNDFDEWKNHLFELKKRLTR